MKPKHILENFAKQTTLHGVPKVILARSTLTRCFWSVVCVSAGAIFCLQISEVLRRFFSYPKKVTVEVVSTPVPFPSVSLCNMRNLDFYILNLLNRKFLEDPHPANHINSSDHPFVREYMKTVAKYGPLWYKFQDSHPLIFQEIFSRTTFSANIPQNLISMAAVQLNEFIVTCYFGGNSCNQSNDFTTFFDPYYFNCFTYSAPFSRGGGGEGGDDEGGGGGGGGDDDVLSLSEGIENGWSAIVLTGSGMLDKNSEIRVLPGIHESRSAVAASEGVRVVIHPPGTQPFPFAEGHDVPPGYSASFGIRPRRNVRIGAPHGNCSHRNPFGGGGGIENSGRYRGISCQKMCLQSHVIRNCDCYDTSLPRLNDGQRRKPCRRMDEFPDSCMFNATDECFNASIVMYRRIQCARDTRDHVTRNTSLMSECLCHPPCDEFLYEVSYSLSKWPATGYEGDAAYMDVFYVEDFKQRFERTPKNQTIHDYFKDEDREETMKDFARLNVYVADSNVIKTQESPDYEPNQLVSDIGGQLGIWVGISIITLSEVIELTCMLVRHLMSGEIRNPRSSDLADNGRSEKFRNGKTSSTSSARSRDRQQHLTDCDALPTFGATKTSSSRYEENYPPNEYNPYITSINNESKYTFETTDKDSTQSMFRGYFK